MRPTKGEMNEAPALAASSAWLAEKHSVTLTMRFISVRIVLQAFRPSSVSGTLMQTLGAILASTSASAIMSLYSVATTSAETGPSTMSQICLVTSAILPPDFRISDGLVVTPSSSPRSLQLTDILDVGGVDKKFHGGSPDDFVVLGEGTFSVAL